MNYLKSYENEAAYLADATEARMKSGAFPLPNVSFVQDTKAVHYNKYREFISVGDIYVSNGTDSWFMKLNKFLSLNDNSITPIGILVIPKEHMANNKHRVMSLVNMWSNTPEIGDVAEANKGLYSGTLNFSSSEMPILSTQVIESNGEYNINTESCIIKPDGTYTSDNHTPNVFLNDGTRNLVWNYNTIINGVDFSTNALADTNGIYNTNTIISHVTANWSGKTITDKSDYGYCTPACCCRRFHTIGTIAGDWYLPAFGELAYICENIEMINNVLNELHNANYIANRLYLYSTSGTIYYGSSTLSQYGWRVICFGYNTLTDIGITGRVRTRAFLQVD